MHAMKHGAVDYAIVDADDLDSEARINDRRIAYLWCTREDDRLMLEDFQVEPGYRRRGIGSQLLKVVLDTADRAGIRVISGKVTADDLKNTPGLLDWYERNGFVITDPEAHDSHGPVAVKMIVRHR